jgi:hypothetical protein
MRKRERETEGWGGLKSNFTDFIARSRKISCLVWVCGNFVELLARAEETQTHTMHQKLHEGSEITLEANSKIFASLGRLITHPIRAVVIISLALGLFVALSVGVKPVGFNIKLENL